MSISTNTTTTKMAACPGSCMGNETTMPYDMTQCPPWSRETSDPNQRGQVNYQHITKAHNSKSVVTKQKKKHEKDGSSQHASKYWQLCRQNGKHNASSTKTTTQQNTSNRE